VSVRMYACNSIARSSSAGAVVGVDGGGCDRMVFDVWINIIMGGPPIRAIYRRWAGEE
jgi:hypothetical protein